ncbi:MAG: hypothetical protein ACP5XB_16070 [Isosphaeraceae bacterium]
MRGYNLIPLILLTILPRVSLARAEEVILPVGSAPEPIAVPHFPSRLHAVVWRNWQLVSPAKLAEVVGASEEQITRLAESMGLPPAGTVPPELKRRAYITIIRRNWHLLPYEQLLKLLDMSRERLAFALREDDFLFIKLGNLKPKCSPVVYAEPDETARNRAAEIKRLVDGRFGAILRKGGEPRFAFVDRLSRVPADFRPPARKGGEGPRYLSSYFGTFGDPLADGAADSFPDGLLARLASSGVNGVWLHVVLRQLAPGGPDFPEFGQGWERRLANLRRLVARAGKYGIDVYLYMNEPRAMPISFFAHRAGLAGVREGDHQTMCTSTPAVRAWLKRGLAHVFREVPQLGGVFTITYSENLTNCASHGQQAGCPRCRARQPAEIIAEVNAAIEEGVHRGSPAAKVIVWDWSWPNPDPIALLPRNVWFMSVSEWSLPITRGGVATTVGEYSLSAVGPGPRATKHWAIARDHGLKTVAKVQLNNTWELSSVPSLPVLDLVARHCKGLARQKVSGMMMSWSLGGCPSPNLLVARCFADNPDADPDAVLDDVAATTYGAHQAAKVRAAWKVFSEAFSEYPYDGSVLYTAPQQYGPANLLFSRPTHYRATMVGFPYDDLATWHGVYPPEVLAGQFEKIADGWEKGVALWNQVDGSAAASDRPQIRAAGLHFRSVANQVRFILARAAGRRGEMIRILDAESKLAAELLPLTLEDSRIGFESSNQYYYTPLDMVEKVINCEYIKSSLTGKQH